MPEDTMPAGNAREKLEEQAALYALGLLPESEIAEFERLLDTDSTAREAVRVYAETAAELAAALPAQRPRPDVRQRMMERVASDIAVKSGILKASLRAGEGSWAATGLRGISVKMLYTDLETGLATMLLRMEPGAAFPAHRHAKAEQCYVLEGDVGWGDLVYHAGDFVCASTGSVHPTIHTKSGNLMLIIGDPHNEFVR
jgi:anti-sigma factor ChrR (cupin superfamily)